MCQFSTSIFISYYKFWDAELRVDDIVQIRNCRPISKRKRFTLEKVLESPETEHDLARAQGRSIDPSTLKSGSVLEALRQ
jgi:hypothetical protein